MGNQLAFDNINYIHASIFYGLTWSFSRFSEHWHIVIVVKKFKLKFRLFHCAAIVQSTYIHG